MGHFLDNGLCRLQQIYVIGSLLECFSAIETANWIIAFRNHCRDSLATRRTEQFKSIVLLLQSYHSELSVGKTDVLPLFMRITQITAGTLSVVVKMTIVDIHP